MKVNLCEHIYRVYDGNDDVFALMPQEIQLHSILLKTTTFSQNLCLFLMRCFQWHRLSLASIYSCKDRRTCLRRCFKEEPWTYRLQIFLVRDQYLRSLPPHRDQTIAGQLEKHVLKPVLAILTTYMETRLLSILYVFKIF